MGEGVKKPVILKVRFSKAYQYNACTQKKRGLSEAVSLGAYKYNIIYRINSI